MTTIEVRPPGGSYSEIEYGDYEIDHGTSDVTLAPTATVDSIRGAAVDVGDDLRITAADGTTQFVGSIEATPIEAGQGAASLRLEAKHPAYRLFDEEITFTEGTPTDDEAVLTAALAAATEGGDFTLDYAGTPTSLSNAYDVERRPVKRVFRDMVEKTGRVWWIGVDNTIHVEPRGARGVVATVDTATDDAAVTSYDPADVDTVINDVTVTGTGDVAVSASATDSNSISTYGPRSESPNYEFITTQQEAQELADALLQPVPLPSAEATLARSVADIRLPIVNYELDITDAQGTTLDDTLEIQSQTVLEGYATVNLGEGAGVNIAKYNRQQKSADDKTAAGSVVDGNRIADDSVDTNQLVDTAVIEDKLDDLAVTLNKIDSNAIDETKVQDDSIATPALQAEAVTANEILANSITANQIAAGSITANEILAGTITAGEIATGTLTANEIDTLDLDTNSLSIGTTNTDGGIEFGILTGTPFGDIAVMEPTADQAASIGQSSNTFYEGHFGSLFFASATWDPGTAPSVFFEFDQNFNSNIYPETQNSRLGTPSNRWGTVYGSQGRFTDIFLGASTDTQITTQPGTTGIELLPATNGDCKVGNGNFQFDEIHAESFISNGSVIGGSGSIGNSTDAPFSIDSTSSGQNASFTEDANGDVVLDLDDIDFDQATLDGRVDFYVDGSTFESRIEPSNNNSAVGTSGTPFGTVYTDLLSQVTNIVAPDSASTLEIDPPVSGAYELTIQAGGTGTIAELIPNDNVWDLGNSANGWQNVYAYNYVTLTPEQIADGVAFDDILGYRWRKPPEYVAQRSQGDDGYRRANPTDGVDLGHMANYLFEVTKSQSETIQDQSDRIDALEDTVADLEARLSELEGANA